MLPALDVYMILLGVIVLVGVMFRKSPAPTALLLVIVGMALSFTPGFPRIHLDPYLVLDVFLPLLLYVSGSESSWRDVKSNFRPIAWLSIGHVVFIASLVAVAIRMLIPEISWPMAFVLGAVISPPDDVAIVAIAEKIRMPTQIVTILKGEGMFNDAAALILFRFALAAVILHEFSAIEAVSAFIVVVVGEVLYGLILGNLLGQLRLKFNDPILQMIVSLITPFIAYLPAARLGGCGVLATVVTGLVIGYKYREQFPAEVRLLSRSIWDTLEFIVQSILFLLVGLELRFIYAGIGSISDSTLMLYGGTVILAVILGRFVWVYGSAYIPRFLFRKMRKKSPYPPWQYPFITSWAGMRGGVSLAAALSVPALAGSVQGSTLRDLLIFLVFCVIIATLLLQGLTLPWLLRVLGITKEGEREEYKEHIAELTARIKMAEAVLHWLAEYEVVIKDNVDTLEEVKLQIRAYRLLKMELNEQIKGRALPEGETAEEPVPLRDMLFVSSQIVEIERKALLELWHTEKINHAVTNKLMQAIDYRARQLEQ